MDCKHSYLFYSLKARELNGFGAVRKANFLRDLSSDHGGIGMGVLPIEHDYNSSPPLGLSFSKAGANHSLLVVSDEDGYVSLYDTRRRLPSQSCSYHDAGAKLCDWVAHQNAIFDVCWNKDNTQILTASGDQSIKIWDSEKQRCLGVMKGHKGSVKSICCHSSNPDIIVSGSRDGSFALWDSRSKFRSNDMHGQVCFMSTAMINDAHCSQRRRTRRGKEAGGSITSVLHLRDEVSIATAGATDSVVRFWDTRKLESPFAQAHMPSEASTSGESRQHGISSLSQDAIGVSITAACMDNRIYVYNVLQLDKGPKRTFTGCQIGSFYVKTAICPDGRHVLSGSTDGNAYIWQVDEPETEPIILEGHDGEVTAVDWCSSEMGKIATAADDMKVRVWNFQKISCSSAKSPSSMRRRITAISSLESRVLIVNEPTATDNHTSDDLYIPSRMPFIRQGEAFHLRTPDSGKKRSLESTESECHKTPDSALKSPSSVLNPPSSLKRKTIRDYFVTTPI